MFTVARRIRPRRPGRGLEAVGLRKLGTVQVGDPNSVANTGETPLRLAATRDTRIRPKPRPSVQRRRPRRPRPRAGSSTRMDHPDPRKPRADDDQRADARRRATDEIRLQRSVGTHGRRMVVGLSRHQRARRGTTVRKRNRPMAHRAAASAVRAHDRDCREIVGIVHTADIHHRDWTELCRGVPNLAARIAAHGGIFGAGGTDTPSTILWGDRAIERLDRAAHDLPPAMTGIGLVITVHTPGIVPRWTRRNVLCIDTEVHIDAQSRRTRTQRSKAFQGSSRVASPLPAMPRVCAASASSSTTSSAAANAA